MAACFASVLVMAVIGTIVFPCVLAKGNSLAVFKKLQRLDGDVIDLKAKVPEIERRVYNDLILAAQYLEAKLVSTIVPNFIEKKVDDYLYSIQEGKLEGIVSKYVEKQVNKTNQLLSLRLADTELERDQLKKMLLEEQQRNKDVENIGMVTTQIRLDLNTTNEKVKEMELERENCKTKLSQGRTDIYNILSATDVLEKGQSFNRKMLEDIETRRVEYWQQMNTSVEQLKEGLESIRGNLEQTNDDVTRLDKRMEQELEVIQQCGCQNISGKLTPSVLTSVSTSTPSTTPTPQVVMDLLLAPFEKKDNFKRYHLKSNTTTNFNLPLQKVERIFYIPSTRSLLVSHHPNSTYLLGLYDADTLALKRQWSWWGCKAFAIDDKRDIVFMVTHTPRSSIRRMDADGNGFRRIIYTSQYSFSPNDIAVDPKRSVIYMCVDSKLMRLDYDGLGTHQMYTGSYLDGVTMDKVEDVLYFTANAKLMKWKLFEDAPEEIFRLGYKSYTLLYYNNTVFAHKWKDIRGIYLGGDTPVETLSLTLESGISGMCFIPAVFP